jgi:dephospho-CoA kinase
LIVVGLTGGIGSGKSTASEMFRELGAHIIDYDILARQVVEPYQSAWNGIVDTFGNAVLNEDMTLNREKLGEIVFNDPEKLQTLNKITHPAVFDTAEKHVEAIMALDRNAFIIKDVPLLIETGIHKTVAKIIVVAANLENRLLRLVKRGLTEVEALKRIESQMPIEEKVKLADFVIENDGSFDETRVQVERVYKAVRSSE